jgi:hypothetical protein
VENRSSSQSNRLIGVTQIAQQKTNELSRPRPSHPTTGNKHKRNSSMSSPHPTLIQVSPVPHSTPPPNPFPFLSISPPATPLRRPLLPQCAAGRQRATSGRPSPAAADDPGSSPPSCSCGNRSVGPAGRRRGRRRPASRGISRSTVYLAYCSRPSIGGKVRRDLPVMSPPWPRRRRGRGCG